MKEGACGRVSHRHLRRFVASETRMILRKTYLLSFIPVDELEADDTDHDGDEPDQQDDAPAFQDVLYGPGIERILHLLRAEDIHLHTEIRGLDVIDDLLHLRDAPELINRREERMARQRVVIGNGADRDGAPVADGQLLDELCGASVKREDDAGKHELHDEQERHDSHRRGRSAHDAGHHQCDEVSGIGDDPERQGEVDQEVS